MPPVEPYRFDDIKSWTPAIDPRAITEGTTFVLGGQNYVFDSKGPKSAFASRLLNGGSPLEVVAPNYNVWSLDGFIFTPNIIGGFSQDDSTFVSQFEFGTPVQGALVRLPWTRANFGDVTYYCQRSIGILKFDRATGVFTAFDPGVLTPIAISESNGRLLVLGIDIVAWSGPNDPEDFTPALGGAGFQTLNERIGGNAITLIPLSIGYIIYTTRGGLVGEYIGGDLVFRHVVSENRQIPLSASAVTQLVDGSYVLCTQQGLHLQSYTGEIQSLTPTFNEYIRTIILDSGTAGFQVRLDYIAEEDRLYVQTRDWTNSYNRTYVLALALDKWGEFSELHFGIIRHGLAIQPVNAVVGYIDAMGVPHRFMGTGYDRETTPGVYRGLDSEIVLGPVRSPRLLPYADTMQEVQGITLGIRSEPNWSEYEEEDLGAEPDSVEDELSLEDSVEDQDSPHLALPQTSFQLELISDLSGFDLKHPEDVDSESELVLIDSPSLIRESGHAKYYSIVQAGVWHRLRFRATEPGEYFHVTFGEATLSYVGSL